MATEIDVETLATTLLARAINGRVIAAIAGPPGAGKSTVAARLCERLNRADGGAAAILPMDGYHLDDTLITPLGLRPRKGIPETFDPDGLYHMLVRLRADTEPQVAAPARDISMSRSNTGTATCGSVLARRRTSM